MRARVFALVLVAAIVCLPAAPAAGDASAVHIRRVDASDFRTVALTVSVDGSVDPADLNVTENGQPVSLLDIRPLSDTGQRIDVVLAIDTSDSVRGAPLGAAVDAAQGFLEALPPDIGVGVVTFADRPTVVLPVTADRSAARQAIDSIGATSHGTALYDAVAASVNMFSGDAQHNVVLLTDGADVGSRGTLNDAVASAKRSDVLVWTIGLGGKTESTVLETLATATGGTHVPAVAQADLPSIYRSIAGELSSQYVLVYRSRSAGGAQATVDVSAGLASDRSILLMPRVTNPVAPVPAESEPFLRGTTGLVVALALSFLAAAALLSLLLGGIARKRRDRELARRMSSPKPVDPTAPPRPDQGIGTWVPDSVANVAGKVAEVGGFKESLEGRLERAGVPMSPGEYVSITAAAAILGGLVGMLVFHSVVFILLFAAVGSIVPLIWLGRRAASRVNKLHDQLPDVLMMLASSLRAGYSFLQALDAVAKEIGDPSAPEFARLVTEIRLGRPAEDALNALAERVGTEEFKWAMLAVNVQREVGGNLAEILDTLAETVREREAVRRQVKVLSAEGRLSIKIMIAIPPLLTLYITKVNPEYMRLLWTTRVGWVMLGSAIFLMLLGIVIARKVVKIDV
jgi:tight adherence protein B